jgi:hypothetical protein
MRIVQLLESTGYITIDLVNCGIRSGPESPTMNITTTDADAETWDDVKAALRALFREHVELEVFFRGEKAVASADNTVDGKQPLPSTNDVVDEDDTEATSDESEADPYDVSLEQQYPIFSNTANYATSTYLSYRNITQAEELESVHFTANDFSVNLQSGASVGVRGGFPGTLGGFPK